MAVNGEPRDERDLLAEIGVPRELDDPSGFDLLGVPETCEDDELINRAGRQQVKGLKKWEQYRANPQVQKMATALMARISDAQRRLRTAEGRAQYRKDLRQQRVGRFRERIRASVMPGEPMAEDRLRQWLQVARQYKVSEDAAREVLQGLNRSDNPFAALGLSPVPADDAWPTAFDLLEVEESDTPPPNLEPQAALQRHKLEAAARAGKVSAEEANRIRLYLEEARRTLSSPELTKAYLQNITDDRGNRFAQTVTLAKANGQLQDTTTLIQLVHQGRQMRLSQYHVEYVLEKVAGVKVAELMGSSPALLVSRKTIEAFVRGNGTNCTHTFSVRNDGTGMLEVTLEPSTCWIQLSESELQTETRKDVTLSLLPGYLAPGELAQGVVTVRSNAGEAEIEVKAMLGQPGSEPTPDDYEVAGKYYFWAVLGGVFTLGLIPLSWMLMMNRKQSTFRAFHVLQAMALGVFGFGFIIAIMLLTSSSPSRGSEALTFARVMMPCLGMIGLFAVFGYGPYAVGKFVGSGHNLQIPGLAHLLKRLV